MPDGHFSKNGMQRYVHLSQFVFSGGGDESKTYCLCIQVVQYKRATSKYLSYNRCVPLPFNVV